MAARKGRKEGDVFSGAPENCDATAAAAAAAASADENTKGGERYDGGGGGGGRIEDNVITLGGIFLSWKGSCATSESDSSRRSDSPEIEIATFPFFSSTFATPLPPRAPKIIAPLSFRRRAIREERRRGVLSS